MKTNFKDQSFNHCYDCGYGEKGVHDVGLTFEEAYEIISSRSSKYVADEWVKNECNDVEYRFDTYMIADCEFDMDDWVGSSDL